MKGIISKIKWIALVSILSFSTSCISSKKTLRVAVSANYPPVIYKESGQFKGLEADFAHELAKELGYSIEFLETDWQQIIPTLTSGRADIIMSGMSITQSRSRYVAFTQPIMNLSQMLLIRKNEISRFKKPGNRYYINSNMKVGVSKGTTGEQLVRQYIPANRIRIYETVQLGSEALKNKVIDCYVHDSPTIWSYATKYDSELTGVYWKLSNEKMAWAVRKNNFDLLNSVNRILEKWRYSGKSSSIISKWIPYKIEAK